MANYLRIAITATAALILSSACSQGKNDAPTSAPDTPEAFLKWSMDRYKEMPSFSSAFTMKFEVRFIKGRKDDKPLITKGNFLFDRPNRFSLNEEILAVSDGQDLTEAFNGYMSKAGRSFRPAPETLWTVGRSITATSKIEMLFQFFGGSGRLSHVAKSDRIPISFGAEETFAGERCRLLKFFAKSIRYGHVRLLIGETTGRVYRMQFDSFPIEMMLGDRDPSKPPPKMPEPDSLDQKHPELANMDNWAIIDTVTFDRIDVPAKIEPDSFKIPPPPKHPSGPRSARHV